MRGPLTVRRRCVGGRAIVYAGRVVLTTGTFFRGIIHLGERQIPGRKCRRGAVDSACRQTLSARRP